MAGQFLLAMVLVFALAGCATTGKSASSIQSLEVRVADLEKKLQEKDEEIDRLSGELGQAGEPSRKTPASKVDVSQATKKDIQAALKNAGFYNGAVDGKFGQLTTAAVKDFQKANGLKEDGVVGQQTWAKLSEHLE